MGECYVGTHGLSIVKAIKSPYQMNGNWWSWAGSLAYLERPVAEKFLCRAPCAPWV